MRQCQLRKPQRAPECCLLGCIRAGPRRLPVVVLCAVCRQRAREFLAEASPLSRIDDVRAPLFVIHGRNDPRVPVMTDAATRHAEPELAHTSGSDYTVEHWLAAYAVLYLT